MKLKFYLLGVLCLSAASCVIVDTDLGNGYIPIEQQYEVRTVEIPLTEVQMRKVSNMSGYSSRRITVGSIRDGLFGLTAKSSAFTLIPVDDTLDFGTSPQFLQFHVNLLRDTVSVADDGQAKILQNFHVYSLRDADIVLDSTRIYSDDIRREDFAGCPRVSKSIPVYDGGDSLGFDLSDAFIKDEFGRMAALCNEDGLYVIDTLANYIKDFPGIFISCDDPLGIGGRFNFFDVAISQSSGYVIGNYGELKFRSTYEGEVKDTSFLFMFGATDFPDLSSSTMPDQYAFNCTESEDLVPEGTAAETIYVEGGVGLKPVFPASEMRAKMREEFAKAGLDPDDSTIVINKATIEIPFEMPSNYLDMVRYPETLCPVRKIKYTLEDGTEAVTYANLTDSAISNEDQGPVNRSRLCYSPDISFHAQKIVWLRDTSQVSRPEPTAEQLANYDVWGLIIVTETDVTESDSSTSDYYNQLLYYNYLNSMYGGYGGYGSYGYGGYSGYSGYGYSNYYSMMMYYNMLNSSSSSTSTTQTDELDRDRYYRAELNGPAHSGRVPVLKLTFSFNEDALLN